MLSDGRARADAHRNIEERKVDCSCPALTRPDTGVFIHKSKTVRRQIFYTHSELEGKSEKTNSKIVLPATGHTVL